MQNKFLDRRQAAEYMTGRGFKISHNTLQKFATIGGGPQYHKFGIRVLYSAEDLDAWVAGKLSPARSSTSEAA